MCSMKNYFNGINKVSIYDYSPEYKRNENWKEKRANTKSNIKLFCAFVWANAQSKRARVSEAEPLFCGNFDYDYD